MDTQDVEEIWLPSPLAPDHVRVSSLGRAKTIDRQAPSKREKQPIQTRKGVVLSPWLSKNGYLCVAVKVGDRRTKYLLHRLIASAFCEGYDPALTVNHMDGNKTNNMPRNLEWISLAGNTRHQWDTGLVNLRGELHPGSKITDDQARHIRKCMNAGVSPTALARAIGISVSLCYKIKEGTRHLC